VLRVRRSPFSPDQYSPGADRLEPRKTGGTRVPGRPPETRANRDLPWLSRGFRVISAPARGLFGGLGLGWAVLTPGSSLVALGLGGGDRRCVAARRAVGATSAAWKRNLFGWNFGFRLGLLASLTRLWRAAGHRGPMFCAFFSGAGSTTGW
jgi:hypothetical protein